MPTRDHRVGLIVPSVNVVLEPDFHKTLPSHVTTHSHRLWVEPHGWNSRQAKEAFDTRKRLKTMNSDLNVAVRYLMTADVDIFVYGCTSGSFFPGHGREDRLLQRITKPSGKPAVAATTAMTAALKAVGARRISVATPYPRAINARLKEYLTHAGLEVLAIDGDPRASAGSQSIANEDPSDIARFAAETCVRGSEAIVCPCTAWRALDAVSEVEQRLGLPVITANQAMVWMTLRLLTVEARIRGYGSLFARSLLDDAAPPRDRSVRRASQTR